jgi:hypothetical protein
LPTGPESTATALNARMLIAAGFQIEMYRSFEVDWGWGVMIFRAIV